jgi:hypothetical protein
MASISVTSRSRVSLGGRITPSRPGTASSCSLVLSTAAPQRSVDHAAGRPHERSYVARIRPDGLYYFQDVPPGRYRLVGRDDKDGHVERTVVLPPGEGGARPRVVELDLQFGEPPLADVPPAEPPARPTRRGSATAGRPARASRGGRSLS